MTELPDWPPGTVTILATGAGAPHAIPVSTALRTGPRTVVLALAKRRESLARLREDPRCALTILAAGVAVTVHDHDQPTFEIEAGVRWRWTDADAERGDAEVRAALSRLRS
jgi:flavin reductase (DIM6/NTAB) family NADH-FMN oxidoreductase RutF